MRRRISLLIVFLLKKLNLGEAENIPPDLISRVLTAGIKDIDLSECDLSGIKVPETLPDSIKKLDLWNAKNVPDGLESFHIT